MIKPGHLEGFLPASHIFFTARVDIDWLVQRLPSALICSSHRYLNWYLLSYSTPPWRLKPGTGSGPAFRARRKDSLWGPPPTGTTSGSSPEMAEGSEELSVSTLRASFPTEPVRRAFTGSEGQLYRVHSLSPFKAQAPGRPCGSAGKESACNVEDLGSIPGLGRSPGEGKGYPLHHSCLENSMDCIVHGCKESDMTERLSLSGSWCFPFCEPNRRDSSSTVLTLNWDNSLKWASGANPRTLWKSRNFPH